MRFMVLWKTKTIIKTLYLVFVSFITIFVTDNNANLEYCN